VDGALWRWRGATDAAGLSAGESVGKLLWQCDPSAGVFAVGIAVADCAAVSAEA